MQHCHAYISCVYVLVDACDILALSSSAARCLARESQMRQLGGTPDSDMRPTSQSQDVLAARVVHLPDPVHLPEPRQSSSSSSQECPQPQSRQSAAAVKPIQSKVITEAMASVTERLSWATEELHRSSSVETCCQLCTLIRSCADALQSLQRVECV